MEERRAAIRWLLQSMFSFESSEYATTSPFNVNSSQQESRKKARIEIADIAR